MGEVPDVTRSRCGDLQLLPEFGDHLFRFLGGAGPRIAAQVEKFLEVGDDCGCV